MDLRPAFEKQFKALFEQVVGELELTDVFEWSDSIDQRIDNGEDLFGESFAGLANYSNDLPDDQRRAGFGGNTATFDIFICAGIDTELKDRFHELTVAYDRAVMDFISSPDVLSVGSGDYLVEFTPTRRKLNAVNAGYDRNAVKLSYTINFFFLQDI